MSKVVDKKIGVTGVIGSGKSLVTKYLNELGLETFDCDEYAHYLLTTPGVINEINMYFDVLNDNNEIDRHKLGEIVFNDKNKLEILNNILHPKIHKKISELSNGIIIDAPLIYENQIENLFDIIVVVACDSELMIERIMKRNEFSYDEALKLVNLQIDIKKKIELADYVIYNNGTKIDLQIEVEKFMRWLNDK